MVNIIDLYNGDGWIKGMCPKCKTHLFVKGLPRWSAYTECPECETKLQIHFDFIEIEGEEYDLYDIRERPHFLDS